MSLLVLRRLLSALPTLFGVSILAFGLIRLVPGDPVLLILGEHGASPEMYAQIQRQLGLDRSVFEQYIHFVRQAFHGDLGTSIISKQSVMSEFRERFPATIELSLTALFFALLLGLPAGLVAAVKRNSFADYFLMGGSLVGYSMPIFWWGLVLILIFSVHLGWTPVSGRMDVIYDIDAVTGFMLIDALRSDEGLEAFWQVLRHLALPSVALGTIPMAVIARMTRSSLLEVLGEDYVRTARAKGLSWRRVVLLHALRNALVPIITIIGLMLGTLITGAVLTETIFSWPGIGKWMVASVTARDYPVVQGGILLIASIIVVVNVLVDLVYLWVNPRLRGGHG